MKTWFITGASRGFGRIWAEAALDRGDRVAATARDPETLRPLLDAHGDDVLPIRLDVTDRTAAIAAVQRAAEFFGRLDVVVNNAGYGLFGMVEETTEEEARAQLDTNLFGPLWVTQAALPYLRAQGSGHILQVSSLGGLAAFPTLGLYVNYPASAHGYVSSRSGMRPGQNRGPLAVPRAGRVPPPRPKVMLVSPRGCQSGCVRARSAAWRGPVRRPSLRSCPECLRSARPRWR